jgi:Mrp family chromosome partitioning ATPase
MSHIDEALRKATVDDDVASAEPRAARADISDSALHQYSLEAAAAAEPVRPAVRPRPRSAAPERKPPYPPAETREPVRRAPSAARAAWPDQFNRIAAVLNDARTGRGARVVSMTGTEAGEGKARAVLQLARALSEGDARRVLAIDADLDAPALHELLGIRNVGLADVLCHDVAAPFVEVSPWLTVLAAGSIERRQPSMLASPRMRALLDEWSHQFDWVLVDSPAVNGSSDAHVLARWTDGVVFVIDMKRSRFPDLERAVLSLGRERVVGTILGGFEDGAELAGESARKKILCR